MIIVVSNGNEYEIRVNYDSDDAVNRINEVSIMGHLNFHSIYLQILVYNRLCFVLFIQMDLMLQQWTNVIIF